MFCNLGGKQILLIILGVIILLWFFNWLRNRNKNTTTSTSSQQLANGQQQQVPQHFLNWLRDRKNNSMAHQSGHIQKIAPQQRQQIAPQRQQQIAAQTLINDDDNNGQFTNTPFILYYHYNPNCGACKNFTPVWNEISNKLQNIPGISVRAIDSTRPENETLTFYYNITQTPTIILVTPNKNIEYTGDRNAADIYDFIINSLNEHARQQPQY